MLLSASRDKTLIVWNLTRDETSYGYPKRSLHGHSHIVSDCVSGAIARELNFQSLGTSKLTDVSFTRLSPPTAPTPCRPPGTRLCVSGNCRPETPPVASSATLTTSSPFPSPPTTDKSFPAPATVLSSCGTPSATASTPSPIRATPSGCLAFDSPPTLRTRSSCPPAGTSSSR